MSEYYPYGTKIKFLRQTFITDYFPYIKQENNQKEIEIIRGFNEETFSWHCLICGIDMGPGNPRQLCGKWKCYSYL